MKAVAEFNHSRVPRRIDSHNATVSHARFAGHKHQIGDRPSGHHVHERHGGVMYRLGIDVIKAKHGKVGLLPHVE